MNRLIKSFCFETEYTKQKFNFQFNKNNDALHIEIIELDHENGIVSHYLHLDTITVRPGMRLLAGTIIGTVGGSGFNKDNYYGYHLHISVIRHGVNIDPDVFLRNRLST